MNVPRFAALAFIMAFVSILHAADDSLYSIRIRRPMKKGDVYEAQIQVNQRSTATVKIGDAPAQTLSGTDLDAELTARCEVVEVDDVGKEKQVTITVHEFTSGPTKREILAKGSVIDYHKGVRGTITSAGKELDGKVVQILRVMFGSGEKEYDPDECYGTDIPKKLGDSWPVNSTALAKRDSVDGAHVDSKKVTGQTTLKAVEKVGEGTAVRLVTTVTTKDFMESDPELKKAGIFYKSSESLDEQTRLLPLDGVTPALETDWNMRIHVVSGAGAPDPFSKDHSLVLRVQKRVNIVKADVKR